MFSRGELPTVAKKSILQTHAIHYFYGIHLVNNAVYYFEHGLQTSEAKKPRRNLKRSLRTSNLISVSFLRKLEIIFFCHKYYKITQINDFHEITFTV